MGTQVEVKQKVQTDIKVQEPPMFKVIYVNDEKTSVEFVIESLIEHFDYDSKGAEHITLDIHNNGSATVAVLPYEIAEQKGVEVTVSARSEGYPLMVKIEPEA
jgi:ATP-dependent Clp protease adaptor protein ClpS